MLPIPLVLQRVVHDAARKQQDDCEYRRPEPSCSVSKKLLTNHHIGTDAEKSGQDGERHEYLQTACHQSHQESCDRGDKEKRGFGVVVLRSLVRFHTEESTPSPVVRKHQTGPACRPRGRRSQYACSEASSPGDERANWLGCSAAERGGGSQTNGPSSVSRHSPFTHVHASRGEQGGTRIRSSVDSVPTREPCPSSRAHLRVRPRGPQRGCPRRAAGDRRGFTDGNGSSR